MKTTINNLLIVLFSTLVFTCTNKENKTDATQNEIVAKSANPKKSADIDSPCELVSMEEVKRIFAIELPIELKDVVYTYPTCIYRWKDGKITTSATFGGQEIISKLPSEVLIVMVEKANEAMFKQSTSIYKQPQKVSNVSSMAIWDSRLSQLTFLSNSYLFHVHVKVSKDDLENKEKAIEVSKLIIDKI
ncbi:hypothetical protein [Psychroserpens luteus]|uniref:DUF4367 domain-containing protein n=1 Tax=Psychroserpens luteus TaxID=1434066 RepID=A0ABW5ZX22_9FLAO|nr:hypothetical protein [Psychroserpens luteus]